MFLHNLLVHVHGLFINSLHAEIVYMLVFCTAEIEPERASHWHDCIAHVHVYDCLFA